MKWFLKQKLSWNKTNNFNGTDFIKNIFLKLWNKV